MGCGALNRYRLYSCTYFSFWDLSNKTTDTYRRLFNALKAFQTMIRPKTYIYVIVEFRRVFQNFVYFNLILLRRAALLQPVQPVQPVTSCCSSPECNVCLGPRIRSCHICRGRVQGSMENFNVELLFLYFLFDQNWSYILCQFR